MSTTRSHASVCRYLRCMSGIGLVLLMVAAVHGATSSYSHAADHQVPTDEEGIFLATVLADTEDTWDNIFREFGRTYRYPTLVLFTSTVSSACGFSSSAAGPFYCARDEKIYLDPSFFDDMSRRFGAPGDFAQAYVIAHYVGRHVQKLLGILAKVEAEQLEAKQTDAKQLSVLLELQADCLAGVWAHHANAKGILELGDIDEALNAAAKLDREGVSAERVSWFSRGYERGRIEACDAFGPIGIPALGDGFE